ncbi:MAG: ferredoxin--nitrite reductase [Candidatus Tectimicrobiota bacterium]|nr:MAG: ferredoxin--nitrite reductase [Candidatus Tectomicrobia bacterium]
MVQETASSAAPPVDIPSWELVFKRNSIERLKREKFPLDIIDELPALIAKGYEAIPEEDIVRLNWWGLTHDKPKVGTFMVRIKVPGGYLQPWQLRIVGAIACRYGKDYGELTTRQGLQLHWVRLEELPAVLAELQRSQLTTVGGEGDTVRNITGCPVAGISREELFDVQPVIQEAARFFYGNRAYSNLPRKHKYTISACPYQCNAPEIHDVALIGVVKDGRPGFAVRVGGGLSVTPRLSRDLGVFVPVAEAIEVLRAITDSWQENPRYRLSRAKARIKFMVDDYGPEGVRAMVEARLGRKLEDGQAPAPVADADHRGVHPQKQEGRYYVGFPVPMGWISGQQMQRLADVVEAVGGDIRLTRQQNFIVGNVPQERLDWLVQQVAALGFPLQANKVYWSSIACTSHRFCNYSVAETKGKLQEILQHLDARFGHAVAGLRIFMDGCPHACAHHWVGDIGLMGTTTRTASGARVEAYDITLRGGLGRQAAIGKPLLRRIPSAETTEAIARLVAAWLHEKQARNGQPFSFRDFCDAHTDEDLAAIALGTQAAPAPAAPPAAVVLHIPGPLLHLTGGSDHLEVEAGSVRQLLAAVAQQYPGLAETLLASAEAVNPYVNLYVNGEDIRALQGLDTPARPGDEVLILPAMSGG